MTVRFHIRSGFRKPRGAWVLVIIYDTAEELRAAARSYTLGEEDDPNMLGCFQPAPWRYWVPDGGGPEQDRTYRPFVGVMRLCRPHLSPDVVTHECVHAAAWTFRRAVDPELNLGSDTTGQEEDLAFLVGYYTAHLSNRLHELELWRLDG